MDASAFPSGPFLLLYAGLILAGLGLSLAIPRWLRAAGREHYGQLDLPSLAYLAGGAERFAEALVARLLATRAMAMDGTTGFRIVSPDAATGSAERGILALPTPALWRQVKRALASDASALDNRLVAQGLLVDRSTGAWLRLWQGLPLLVVFAVGLMLRDVGIARERPVGFLTGMVVITSVLALVRLLKLDRKTAAGAVALAAARAGADRLRRAPLTTETGMAVALFGTVVLAESPWAEFHKLRTSGGDGGGSGDGGSGCGGGGCGGCGG